MQLSWKWDPESMCSVIRGSRDEEISSLNLCMEVSTKGDHMSFNKITMVGNVGRDPELRQLADGAKVCNFNIAVNETSRDKKGRLSSAPTWFRITVWGERAAICARNLRKGSAVYVVGRLKPKQWEDKQGERHISLEVKASDIRFFGLADSRSVKVA